MTTPAEPATRMARGTRLRAAGALLLLFILIAALPAVLVVVGGLPFAHGIPSASRVLDALRRPDDGSLLLTVFLVLAWAGWFAFTVATAAEVVALVRRRVPPTLRGLGALQPFTARLLTTAALLLPAGTQTGLAAAAATPIHLAVATTQHSPATAQTPLASPVANEQTVPVRSAKQIAPVLPVYVVSSDSTGQRDTLWSIAERHLGDPLRWSDIAQLNYGQPQPDGGVFTDPALIRPGWTLRLPADAHALPATPQTPTPPVPVNTPAATTPAPSLPPVPAPVIAPPDTTAPADTDAVPDEPHQSSPARTPQPTRTEPPAGKAQPTTRAGSVRLGTTSEIGIGLVSSILFALTLRQLRRRRTYKPSPPRPAQLQQPKPSQPPALRQLLGAAPKGLQMQTIAAAVTETSTGWEIGTANGNPIRIDRANFPTLALAGPGAANALRALLTSLLLDRHEILLPKSTFEGLVPGVPIPPGMQLTETAGRAAELMELEVLSRTRRLNDAGLADAAAYRNQHPEDPFPPLILIQDQYGSSNAPVPAASGTAHLDITVVALTDTTNQTPADAAFIRVADDGTVLEAHPAELANTFDAGRLHRLTIDDAIPILTALYAPDPQPLAETEPEPPEAVPVGPEWTPQVSTSPAVDTEKPIRVQLLGPIRIWVEGVPVTTGLRESARELLAWYALHPEGKSAEAAIDALWPDVPVNRGPQRFWTALGNLRSRLKTSDGEKLSVLEKTGGIYRLDAGNLDLDLWHFQAALREAARAVDDVQRIELLRAVKDSYLGPFAEEADYLWVDPVRNELHRRALDAHVELARLQQQTGLTDTALATLERAIELDPYAEILYRHLIQLQRQAGRDESIRLTWKQLCARLGEIDEEPAPETTRLHRAICSVSRRPPAT